MGSVHEPQTDSLVAKVSSSALEPVARTFASIQQTGKKNDQLLGAERNHLDTLPHDEEVLRFIFRAAIRV